MRAAAASTACHKQRVAATGAAVCRTTPLGRCRGDGGSRPGVKGRATGNICGSVYCRSTAACERGTSHSLFLRQHYSSATSYSLRATREDVDAGEFFVEEKEEEAYGYDDDTIAAVVTAVR